MDGNHGYHGKDHLVPLMDSLEDLLVNVAHGSCRLILILSLDYFIYNITLHDALCTLFHDVDQPWWPQWPQRMLTAAVLLVMHSKQIEQVRHISILVYIDYKITAN